MKKLISLALILLLLAGTFGCAGSTEQSVDSGTGTEAASPGEDTPSAASSTGDPAPPQGDVWDYELDTSPYEFTVWWPSVWPWAKTSVENGWPDEGVTKAITEATGVKMNIDMPSGAEADIAGPLIASGQYPDMMIFSAYNSPYAAQMQEGGALYCISDLMDEYAPRMWEVVTPTLMQHHADEDGKLWKYVGFEYDQESIEASLEIGLTPSSGGNIMFVRRDVLEAFGKEDIRSLDELTELLVFTRQNFPELDPIKLDSDITSGMFANHMCAIFGMHLSKTYPQGDSLELVFKDPKYMDYVGWLNGLYREGVITDNMLADSDQAKDEKTFAGKYAVLVDATFNIYNTVNTTIESNTGSAETTYKAIGPAEKEGIAFTAPSLRSKGGNCVVITQNAEKPDRIIRFLEYLLTDEGQTAITLGVEGISWEEQNGSKVLLPEASELIVSDLQAYAAKYDTLGRWAPFAKTTYWYWYCDDFLTPEGPIRDDNNGRLDPYVVDIWDEGFIDITSSLVVGSPEDLARTRITDIHKTACAKMISSKTEEAMRQEYENFLAEIERAGATQVEEAYTAIYRENLERIAQS